MKMKGVHERHFTNFMGSPKNTVHYADVIGAGEFFGHENRENPVFARLEKIVIEQAKAAIVYGKPVGFARLLTLAYNGQADKAVREVEKFTKGIEEKAYAHGRGDFCWHDTNQLYEGADIFRGMNMSLVGKKRMYNCSHPYLYIDSCFFGARLAELAGDANNARVMYDRAIRALRSVTYSTYSRTIHGLEGDMERVDLWKRSMKRMYKKGMIASASESAPANEQKSLWQRIVSYVRE
ncbi:hypothetical protein C4573_06605 [Candidatus Woesearchaeota archaeon]|nr:MAG: hypothetical protein C4573_06605 [Candidatus Woesearchaeota archaeon]